MGMLPEQARRLPWHDERLLIEGMADEGLIELSEPAADLGTLGFDVRTVG